MKRNVLWSVLILLVALSFASCSEDDVNGLTNNGDVYLTINERQYSNEFNQVDVIGTYFDSYVDELGLGGCYLSASLNLKDDPTDYDDFTVKIASISEYDINEGMVFPNETQEIAVEYLMYSGLNGPSYSYQSGSIKIASKNDDDENRKSVIIVEYKNLVMKKSSTDDRYSIYPELITVNGTCSYRQSAFKI